ncbi:hypothetical protein FS749_008832 [Ceratobasidium sp. UAMH 11750]|nr:hypothetical protein FS749_008832 [Ceratobasidium sp. UAMH 11750]
MEGRIHKMGLSNIVHPTNVWPHTNSSDNHPLCDYQNMDVTMAYEGPVVPLQPFGPETPFSPKIVKVEQTSKVAASPKKKLIKLNELWRMRKDAHWEIVAPSKKGSQADSLPNPEARSRPAIWSENLYDAQDALTYFSVGQTILTSKFRKLIACRDTGVPVKLLATGDFPSLPIVRSEIELDDGTSLKIGGERWRNGLVVLGFFFVKKVEEDLDKHVFTGELDIDNGKSSGEAHWNFELQSCDSRTPPWWCPLGGDSDSDSDRDDSDFNTPAKRPRVDFDKRAFDEMDIDENSDSDEMGSGMYARPEFQSVSCRGVPLPSHLTVDPSIAHETIQPLPNPNTANPQPTEDKIRPEMLGLVLEPKEWPEVQSMRPPQIRASLLLGWHCKTCGKLNPRIKWDKTQECPLCKAKTEISFPEWHRKAHTEAAGPIGTLHRLDDGGHSHKTGLHALASRDPESGMTCVEYWLADPPLPILAELGRIKPTARTRRGGLPARPAPRPNKSGTSQPLASPAGGNCSISPHNPRIVRDIGGSRAMFAKDNRMLFVHVTCPQHANLSNVPDRVFSEFASQVRMERQVNTKEYRTGRSSLSCHYTYLAGVGTSMLHTSSPAVGWQAVPDCVYNAHKMLVDMQCYAVDDYDQNQFNQSVFVVGSGGNGVNAFKMVHRAEDGPVGYMVLGASCEVQLMVGDGQGKRTTKAGAQRRAEVLMAHGDALFTSAPKLGDLPIEVRVKRTGLAVVLVARCFKSESAPPVEPPHTQEAETAMEGVVYEATSNPIPPAPKPKGQKRKSRP